MVQAEIHALRHRFGLSYKDAAHRLYMADIERLKKADVAAKSFAAFRNDIDDVITNDILAPLRAIDNGAFDSFIFKDGKWVEETEEEQEEEHGGQISQE
jgi:hypothetical protein